MTAIKACIFDLDGVLVDTAKYHYIAWREIAQELGFEFSEDDNEQLKGISRVKSMEILLEIGGIELSEERKNELMDKKNRQYVAYISKMTKEEVLKGVFNLLEELKEKNIKIALGSASKNAMLILERVGLVDKFEAIIDGNKVSKAKPDPEIFLKAAKELKVSPTNCVVFEDAEAGVEAALAAKMYVVGVGNPENLGKADMIVPSLKGITFDKVKFLATHNLREI